MYKYFYWIIGAIVVLYFANQSKTQTGQEGNNTTATTGSNPFWTVGSAWYSQHFPNGAQ
jgi:hypothetical protein